MRPIVYHGLFSPETSYITGGTNVPYESDSQSSISSGTRTLGMDLIAELAMRHRVDGSFASGGEPSRTEGERRQIAAASIHSSPGAHQPQAVGLPTGLPPAAGTCETHGRDREPRSRGSDPGGERGRGDGRAERLGPIENEMSHAERSCLFSSRGDGRSGSQGTGTSRAERSCPRGPRGDEGGRGQEQQPQSKVRRTWEQYRERREPGMTQQQHTRLQEAESQLAEADLELSRFRREVEQNWGVTDQGTPASTNQPPDRRRAVLVHPMPTDVGRRRIPYQPSTVELIEEEPGQEDEVERDTIRLREIERRGRVIHLRLTRAEEENLRLRKEQGLGGRREVLRGFHFPREHPEEERLEDVIADNVRLRDRDIEVRERHEELTNQLEEDRRINARLRTAQRLDPMGAITTGFPPRRASLEEQVERVRADNNRLGQRARQMELERRRREGMRARGEDVTELIHLDALYPDGFSTRPYYPNEYDPPRVIRRGESLESQI